MTTLKNPRAYLAAALLRDDNIVARINRAAGVAVELDDETADLIDFAATL